MEAGILECGRVGAAEGLRPGLGTEAPGGRLAPSSEPDTQNLWGSPFRSSLHRSRLKVSGGFEPGAAGLGPGSPRLRVLPCSVGRVRGLTLEVPAAHALSRQSSRKPSCCTTAHPSVR